MRRDKLLEVIECQTGIENILYQDHVFALQRFVDVFRQPNFARALGAFAVAGDGDKVEARLDGELAREIAEKNRSAFEHTQQQHRFVAKVAADLRSHCGDACCDLFVRKKKLKSGCQRRYAHGNRLSTRQWRCARTKSALTIREL